jgi:AraC-like DNA-binding protein
MIVAMGDMVISVGGNLTGTPAPTDWSIPAHSHAADELVFVCEGVIETTMNGRTFIAARGSAKMHPATVPHAERALDGIGPRLIWISWRNVPGIEGARLPQIVSDHKGRMRMMFEWMWENSISGDPNLLANQEMMLRVLVTELTARRAEQTSNVVTSVRAYVQRRLAQTIYLDDLARHVGVSKYYFTRMFGELTGQSPMEYVRAMRVEAARALLLTSALPLRAIAPRVGFTDEFQLSRVFRQVTGTSPGSVRKLIRTAT